MPAFLRIKIYNGMSVLHLSVEIRPHHLVFMLIWHADTADSEQ